MSIRYFKGAWRLEHIAPKVEDAGIPDVYKIYQGDKLICELNYKHNEANAHRIASCPELLSALKEAVYAIENGFERCEERPLAIDFWKQTIAKAKGESK